MRKPLNFALSAPSTRASLWRSSRRDYRETIELRAASLVQPDICHCGGIAEGRRIAAMVETYQVGFAPHNTFSPVNTVASAHLALATPNFVALEILIDDIPWRNELLTAPLDVTGGILKLGDQPGPWGIELDLETCHGGRGDHRYRRGGAGPGRQVRVDPARIRKVLLGGFAQSRILDVHGQRMLTAAYAPGFRIRLHRKDLAIATDIARLSGAAAPMSLVAAQLFNAVASLGDADLDHSALARVIDRLADRSLSTPVDPDHTVGDRYAKAWPHDEKSL